MTYSQFGLTGNMGLCVHNTNRSSSRSWPNLHCLYHFPFQNYLFIS